MDYENELYAERLRRKAQDAALASGAADWTEELNNDVRVKLTYMWTQLTNRRAFGHGVLELESFIADRTMKSIAFPLKPEMMRPGAAGGSPTTSCSRSSKPSTRRC